MSVNRLLNLKKEKPQFKRIIQHKTIIYGAGTAAQDLLLNKKDEDAVLITSDDYLNPKKANRDVFWNRGKANLEASNAALEGIPKTSLGDRPHFYKDQKFRPFDGKAKPSMPLHADEFYFLEEAFEFKDIEKTLPLFAKEKLYFGKYINEIFREENRWIIVCKDLTRFECEELIFAENPNYFLEKFRDRNQLSDGFVSFCESVKPAPVLAVNISAEGIIYESEHTLFIPQSLTHDFGYFIGCFFEADKNKNQQQFEFFCYLRENFSPEQIEKKYRSLLACLRRIFPQLKKLSLHEDIQIKYQEPRLKIDDKLFADSFLELENFSFAGPGAPLKHSDDSVNNFADCDVCVSGRVRSELSVQQYLK